MGTEDFMNKIIFTLNTEGYFRLLQYDQLKELKKNVGIAQSNAEEARADSKKATNIAIWAIIIGGIVGIVQILINLLTLN